MKREYSVGDFIIFKTSEGTKIGGVVDHVDTWQTTDGISHSRYTVLMGGPFYTSSGQHNYVKSSVPYIDVIAKVEL